MEQVYLMTVQNIDIACVPLEWAWQNTEKQKISYSNYKSYINYINILV